MKTSRSSRDTQQQEKCSSSAERCASEEKVILGKQRPYTGYDAAKACRSNGREPGTNHTTEAGVMKNTTRGSQAREVEDQSLVCRMLDGLPYQHACFSIS